MQFDSANNREFEIFAKVFKQDRFITDFHSNSFGDSVKNYNMDFVQHIFLFLMLLTFVTYSRACVRDFVWFFLCIWRILFFIIIKHFVVQNGYKLQVVKLESCAGSIGKIDPTSTATLTNDCKLILKGCGEVEAFATAKVTDFPNSKRIFE